MGCTSSKPVQPSPHDAPIKRMRSTGVEDLKFPTVLLDSYDVLYKDHLDEYGGSFKVQRSDDGMYATGVVMAMKTTASLKYVTPQHLAEEAYHMECLNHENIAQLYDCYKDMDTKPYCGVLVRERTEGRKLIKELQKRKRFEEYDAREIVVQIANALQHCKDHGVVLRGLNLETVGFKDVGGTRVLVQNLRYACTVAQHSAFNQMFGSYEIENDSGKIVVHSYPLRRDLQYIAPEALKRGNLGRLPPVDVWSFGVVLYVLLAGYTPFAGESTAQVCEAIRKGNYTAFKYDLETWNGVSAGAKDLIAGCLRKNPAKRFTIEQVLEHPWILKFDNHTYSSFHGGVSPKTSVDGRTDKSYTESTSVGSIEDEDKDKDEVQVAERPDSPAIP